jgi:pimeloyl-ACP methyl ester carboxylesterase
LKPTIVFLHGLASNGSRWWDFAARTRLKDWRILRPSLRGAAPRARRAR